MATTFNKTTSLVKFYRGVRNKYDYKTNQKVGSRGIHENGIYFSTDTNEILMNGISFGGGSGALYDVQIGHMGGGMVVGMDLDTGKYVAKFTEDASQPGTGNTALLMIFQLASEEIEDTNHGFKYQEFDVSTLLTESEFKDGLTVNNGIVKVLIDGTGNNCFSATVGGLPIANAHYVDVGKDGISTHFINEIKKPIQVKGVNIGDVKSGALYDGGTDIETILRKLLSRTIGVKNVNPTWTYSNTNSTSMIEVGSAIPQDWGIKSIYTDGKFVPENNEDPLFTTETPALCKPNHIATLISAWLASPIKRTSTDATLAATLGLLPAEFGEVFLDDDTIELIMDVYHGSSQATHVQNNMHVDIEPQPSIAAEGDASKNNPWKHTSRKLIVTRSIFAFLNKTINTIDENFDTFVRSTTKDSDYTAEKKAWKRLGESSSFHIVMSDTGAKQVIIAYPSSWGKIKEIFDNNSKQGITGNFCGDPKTFTPKTTAQISGKITGTYSGPQNAAEYNIYYFNSSNTFANNIDYTIKIG